MSDQAAQLRHLVLRAARLRDAESHAPPRMVAVCGARHGVGTTAIAASLSRALVEQGSRVVAIDMCSKPGALAQACELPELPAGYTSAMARRDIHEALVRATGGLQIVPGVWDADCPPSDKAAPALLKQFQTLGRHADWLVLDLGCGPTCISRSWRDAVEQFLIVTTPQADAVMDTYALIKQALVARAGRGVELVVNQAAHARAAGEVADRVDRSCRRFLGFSISLACHVPPNADLPAALCPIALQLCEPAPSQVQRRAA